MDSLISGVQDQPVQYGEILSLQKKEKLAGHGGVHLGNRARLSKQNRNQKLIGRGGRHLKSQLLGRLSQENHLHPGGRGGCSELRLCHCIPDGVTE